MNATFAPLGCSPAPSRPHPGAGFGGKRMGDYRAPRPTNGILYSCPSLQALVSRPDLSPGRRGGAAPAGGSGPALHPGRQQQARPTAVGGAPRLSFLSPRFTRTFAPAGSPRAASHPVGAPDAGGSEPAGCEAALFPPPSPPGTHSPPAPSERGLRARSRPGVGARGEAEGAGREGGVVKVRVQPPSPAALPPPDDGGAEREGEERSGTRPHTPETSSWEAERRGGKGAAPPPLLAPAKEGESPGLLCPPRHGLTAPSAPISAPIAPETGPCPAPHTRCPDRAPPQPGRRSPAAKCARP